MSKTIAVIAGNHQQFIHFYLIKMDIIKTGKLDITNSQFTDQLGDKYIYINNINDARGLILDEILEIGTARERSDYDKLKSQLEIRVRLKYEYDSNDMCKGDMEFHLFQAWKEARKGYVLLEDVKKIIKDRRDEPNSEWYLLDNILDEIKQLGGE